MLCDFLENHSQQFFQVTNKEDYLQASRMRDNKVWATEVEIFVAATLLQTTIFVFFSPGPESEGKWLKHDPVFKTSLPAEEGAIYLQNLNEHFQPVLRIDWTGFSSMPAQLKW